MYVCACVRPSRACKQTNKQTARRLTNQRHRPGKVETQGSEDAETQRHKDAKTQRAQHEGRRSQTPNAPLPRP